MVENPVSHPMKLLYIASICVGIVGLGVIAFFIAATMLSKQSMFLTPTKTASRSIARSFSKCTCKNPPRVALMHATTPANVLIPAKDYHIVLRHPYDRALSAFSFQKQGGEHGSESEFPAIKALQQYETLEELVVANPTIDHLPLLEPAFQYVNYFKQRRNDPKPIHPICYPKLQESWPELTEKFQCNAGCELIVSNTSKSRSTTLGPHTKAYIDKHLSGDIAIYEKYCG